MYSVTVPSTVVVAIETKAEEVTKEHLFSLHEVIVTKVVVSEETYSVLTETEEASGGGFKRKFGRS